MFCFVIMSIIGLHDFLRTHSRENHTKLKKKMIHKAFASFVEMFPL